MIWFDVMSFYFEFDLIWFDLVWFDCTGLDWIEVYVVYYIIPP